MPVDVLPETSPVPSASDTYLHSALGNLRVALAAAGVLAALALLALLLQLRLAFTALFGMALSLVTATGLLSLFGYTFNALVALGLLLAIALVVAETAGQAQGIASRLSLRPSGLPVPSAGPVSRLVAAACGQLRGALAGAGLAALLCAVPLLIAGGPTASFLRPMAMAFALAVAVSMVVAVTVTPALAAAVLALVPARPHGTPLPRLIAGAYARSIAALVRRPRLAAAGAAACLGLGVFALVLLPMLHPGQPSFTDRALVVRLSGPPGMSLPAMDRVNDAAIAGTSRTALAGYVVAALAGVLLLARAATGGWRRALLAFGSLPVSLAGGVLVVVALGATGDLAAAAGLLAVFAFAAAQAIAVTARAGAGVMAGGVVADSAMAGDLGVILIPAIVTAAVLTPFALFGDLPGMELLHTAAIVILGGLGTTTLVSLFVLPVACRLLGPGIPPIPECP
jgi:Cu/Ag efflux pump CusA